MKKFSRIWSLLFLFLVMLSVGSSYTLAGSIYGTHNTCAYTLDSTTGGMSPIIDFGAMGRNIYPSSAFNPINQRFFFQSTIPKVFLNSIGPQYLVWTEIPSLMTGMQYDYKSQKLLGIRNGFVSSMDTTTGATSEILNSSIHGGQVYDTSAAFDQVSERYFWQENAAGSYWLNSIDLQNNLTTVSIIEKKEKIEIGVANEL